MEKVQGVGKDMTRLLVVTVVVFCELDWDGQRGCDLLAHFDELLFNKQCKRFDAFSCWHRVKLSSCYGYALIGV